MEYINLSGRPLNIHKAQYNFEFTDVSYRDGKVIGNIDINLNNYIYFTFAVVTYTFTCRKANTSSYITEMTNDICLQNPNKVDEQYYIANCVITFDPHNTTQTITSSGRFYTNYGLYNRNYIMAYCNTGRNGTVTQKNLIMSDTVQLFIQPYMDSNNYPFIKSGSLTIEFYGLEMIA